MTNKTQIEWVKRQLDRSGFITRNQCLKRYISRLGAIIYTLKKQGYEFKKGRYHDFRDGRDYVYELK